MFVGTLTVARGWIANGLYRDQVATGAQARGIGVMFVIMGACLVVDAYRNRVKDEAQPGSK